MRSLILAILITFPAITFSATPAFAHWCPFCDAPSLTLAEEVDQSAHVLLAKWLKGTEPTDVSAGTATFEIVAVAKSEAELFKVGGTIMLPQYVSADKKANYILMGPGSQLLDWQVPREASTAAWEYLSELPAPVTSPEAKVERLRYFVDYLQHPELAISNDAYGEFAAARYETIKAIRETFPKEQLEKWIMDPDTPVTRMGLYGLLLGLCGDEDSATVMKQKILTPDASFRLGIEGVISGYLIIRGADGLKVLEDNIINAESWSDSNGEQRTVPFSEIFAVMQALRFMWTYEPDVIPQDRLKTAMHRLLEKPQLTDLVIADLARWEDWSRQERLMEMYDQDEYAIPSVKRAIVRYMFYGSRKTVEGSEELTEEAKKAAENLKILEKKDPKTVKMTKRFLIQ